MNRELIEKRIVREMKNREKKENKILRAAEKVFSKKGFDGTRMEDIAKECNIPKPNLYYYFKSKKVIYRKIISELISDWNKAFDEIAIERDPKEAIDAYIRAKVQYSKQHPIASKIFGGEIIRGSTIFTKKENQAIRKITEEKCAIIEGWMKKGKIDHINPQHLMFMIWASTQFYADFDHHVKNILNVTRLTGKHYQDAEELLTHVILQGCGLTAKK
ncbi:MAG: TetR family transcriptional regulator C-terminal domain-containing protein [Gammaproteobacteria bacterium]